MFYCNRYDAIAKGYVISDSEGNRMGYFLFEGTDTEIFELGYLIDEACRAMTGARRKRDRERNAK